MTYARVIPRDLFNEGNLLSCLGRLWIKLDERRDHLAALGYHCDRDFEVVQDETDGSTSCTTVFLEIGGERVHLFRPLNSRDKWPLWARIGDVSGEFEDIEVFDFDGNLSPEFWTAIAEEKR